MMSVRRIVSRGSAVLLACLVVHPDHARAEAALSSPLTIDAAASVAVAHHPAILLQDASLHAREAQVTYARSGYLPRLDVSVELERGTGNVLRGALFATPGIPSVSGPPTGRNLDGGAFGSVVGAGVSWDALGLVRQMATVDANLAEQEQARWSIAVARLVVAFSAADQFIEVLTRQATVRTAGAAVDRARALATVVRPLVAQELRPGADASRAEAELALASTQMIRAEEAVAIGMAELARALGVAGQHVTLEPGRLLELPRLTELSPTDTKNPLLVQTDAAIASAKARRRAAEWMYLPRLDVVGALWSRGSGLQSGSISPSRWDGIFPDTPNWAAGLVLTWPVLDLVGVRARMRIETAQVEGALAKRTDVAQAIQTEIDEAHQKLAASLRIANNTPVALRAARAAEGQAAARYRAGLATIVEVAEAQRILAQAEIDDAVARLNVRRAMLLVARSFGDLRPFFSSLEGASN